MKGRDKSIQSCKEFDYKYIFISIERYIVNIDFTYFLIQNAREAGRNECGLSIFNAKWCKMPIL